MIKQYRLFFSGTVQGVGFRFTARALAKKHKVKGWVKNLSDGRVEIIAEAEKDNIDNFISELKKIFKHKISGIEKKENKPTQHCQGFRVTF
ncbi:MAG: acylphosphatase [Candidatus Omnitrophica bacterium]|nr:acylphosphatase [Candidatus Omnitrophota bacterium]MCF7895123.1 acylphosphatase [Candidatus Omnitrophota bacterium]